MRAAHPETRGGKLTRITADEAFDLKPFWSPRPGPYGRPMLGFHTNRAGGNVDIWLIPFTGRGAHPVIDPSPLQPGHGDACQGGPPHDVRLTDNSTVQEDGDWSLDGQWIAFRSEEYGSKDIVIRPACGGASIRVTSSPLLEHDPAWSPDGCFIAFMRNSSIGAPGDIWIVEVGTGQETRLTSHSAADGEPDWSPDGRWIVFSSTRSGSRDLYLLEVDDPETQGGTPIRVTDHAGRDETPNWHPKQDRIVFRSDRSGSFDLWVADVSGLTAVSTSPGLTTARQSEEGKVSASPNPFNPVTTLAFSLEAASRYELVIHDVSGREVRRFVGTGRSGQNAVLWNGTNQRGAGVASGVYFVSLIAEGQHSVGRLILTR
jgi:Tol biopolymer transport system component